MASSQCVAQKVPFFFKQWGGFRPKSGGRGLDGRQCSVHVAPEVLPVRAAVRNGNSSPPFHWPSLGRGCADAVVAPAAAAR